jgi:hypothetical protein
MSFLHPLRTQLSPAMLRLQLVGGSNAIDNLVRYPTWAWIQDAPDVQHDGEAASLDKLACRIKRYLSLTAECPLFLTEADIQR